MTGPHLKLLLAISSALLEMSAALGQGTIVFDNTSRTLVSVGPVGQQTLISGWPGSYYFGLFIGAPGSTDPNQFTFTGVYATNVGSSFPGLLGAGGNRDTEVAGWLPLTMMSFFVAGWSSTLGHDWNQQWLSGVFAEPGDFGLSAIATGSSGAGGFQPVPGLKLFGGATGIQTGWNLSPVTSIPEPSSATLSTIGTAFLVFYACSKARRSAASKLIRLNHALHRTPVSAPGSWLACVVLRR